MKVARQAIEISQKKQYFRFWDYYANLLKIKKKRKKRKMSSFARNYKLLYEIYKNSLKKKRKKE